MGDKALKSQVTTTRRGFEDVVGKYLGGCAFRWAGKGEEVPDIEVARGYSRALILA
jgi:hypothetical protein